MTNDLPDPIVPPAREGHRRTFSESDKRRIDEETARPGASLSEVARSYGIAARVLFRWKLGGTAVRGSRDHRREVPLADIGCPLFQRSCVKVQERRFRRAASDG
jgi:hypothetical protein